MLTQAWGFCKIEITVWEASPVRGWWWGWPRGDWSKPR